MGAEGQRCGHAGICKWYSVKIATCTICFWQTFLCLYYQLNHRDMGAEGHATWEYRMCHRYGSSNSSSSSGCTAMRPMTTYGGLVRWSHRRMAANCRRSLTLVVVLPGAANEMWTLKWLYEAAGECHCAVLEIITITPVDRLLQSRTAAETMWQSSTVWLPRVLVTSSSCYGALEIVWLLLLLLLTPRIYTAGVV